MFELQFHSEAVAEITALEPVMIELALKRLGELSHEN